ncbi:acylphosphatase-2 isoform X1 [Apis dorsata]|uniref:acylphosphatase n=2 Tax=Apis TaxID=7459 RepID=A0A7M7G1E8_APIME|nr:acylphosphatase-2 isoform X1 [Apis mellifera]XP_006608452.1 acylphosphatase-2 isoform X1 [Apis dorsata]XP_016906230.1 acylphosphatase-2 isoform X1 [Apis cerana]KAG6802403.1 acylphosphatase-2 isoform X1 [Apis mellifera caucasica]KAG9437890.1 acylphosphatase-2 isoform X1 [Apis mellifera carnica]PBC26931.1 Acylphosphatase-2 [Apis cerana cerana]|eukprot:XP_001120805.1 acylphosphatase-2 isoform X1 [Apis mellifera]
MAADDPLRNEPLVSVEFEVFGKVQGVYFPKYVRDICQQLGICGWVKNTKSGTILGKMQGPRALVDQMAQWLTNVGSPGSQIDRCEFTNWEGISRLQYKGYVIRF